MQDFSLWEAPTGVAGAEPRPAVWGKTSENAAFKKKNVST